VIEPKTHNSYCCDNSKVSGFEIENKYSLMNARNFDNMLIYKSFLNPLGLT